MACVAPSWLGGKPPVSILPALAILGCCLWPPAAVLSPGVPDLDPLAPSLRHAHLQPPQRWAYGGPRLRLPEKARPSWSAGAGGSRTTSCHLRPHLPFPGFQTPANRGPPGEGRGSRTSDPRPLPSSISQHRRERKRQPPWQGPPSPPGMLVYVAHWARTERITQKVLWGPRAQGRQPGLMGCL